MDGIGLLQRGSDKTDAVARPSLSQPPEIAGKHRGDAGVAADGLLAEQNDGLTVSRHLDYAAGHRLGNNAGRRLRVTRHRRAAQAAAHAVALRGEGVLGGEKPIQDGLEIFIVWPGNGTKRDGVGIVRPPGQLARSGQQGPRTPGQEIAGHERAALMAADGPAQVGGTTAQHFGQVKAATDGQVGAAAAFGKTKIEDVTRLDPERNPLTHGATVETRPHGGPGQGDIGRVEKLHAPPLHGQFQGGAGVAIADQPVGHPMRQVVKHAGDRHPQVDRARSAQILHGGNRAGKDDPHRCPHG